MNKNLAPIVLFVYNRPWHTEQTLNALMQNELANESVLYIYADGPKEKATLDQLKKIDEVRRLIRKTKWCKEVNIIKAEKNKGLADSIIDGVTEIVNKYGKIIVLEDDLVCAKGFLSYMNTALDKFADEEKVMQVSGYMFPLQVIPKGESFFLLMATSWGWATWKRAWDFFDPSAQGYHELKTNKTLSNKFDLHGSYPYSAMLISQMENRQLSSWAIRWWWCIFKKRGLALFPDCSLVKNIGYDLEGTHTHGRDPFFLNDFDSKYFIRNFPSYIKVNKSIFKILTSYLVSAGNYNGNPSKLVKGIRMIKKVLSINK